MVDGTLPFFVAGDGLTLTVAPGELILPIEEPIDLKTMGFPFTSGCQTTLLTVNFYALKLQPKLKEKWGVRYRLNRWREEQLAIGAKTTYGNLVTQCILLCMSNERFSPIQSSRYINFLSNFSKNEKNVSIDEALKAWDQLQHLDIPKTYVAWKKSNA